MADQLSTRDPRLSGFKAAMLVRLNDRLKIAQEFSDREHVHWRKSRTEANLLAALITEVEGMIDV